MSRVTDHTRTEKIGGDSIFYVCGHPMSWRETVMTSAIDDLPSWNVSSRMRIVLKGWSFGPKLFISFLSKERIMAQKYLSEIGNFGQRAPRHQSRWSQNIMILETCVFGSSKEFWQAWSCSKSWCIPNYRLSVSFKTHHFFVAWFPKNSRKNFLN